MAAVVVGVATGIVLLADSHTQGGLTSWLRHPWLTSFLHRAFLCAFSSFIALVLVSLLTPPPPESVRAGAFSFSWTRGEGESDRDLRITAAWMAALFLIVSALWWCFR
jgi:hypothetical protein